MRKTGLVLLLLLTLLGARAQFPVDSICETEVARFLHYLASDSRGGRGNYTPNLHRAATFIGQEFKKLGFHMLPGLSSYYQPFGFDPAKPFTDADGGYLANKVLLNV